MFDPLTVSLILLAAIIVGCLVVSIVTGNYSQVDRLWSITPPLYVGVFAAAASFSDIRLDIMFALTLAWGTRLTWNFARKGGYKRGHEDYRWPALREKLKPWQFQAMNATFIAPYQNALLFAIALPAYPAWLARGTDLGWVDGLATALFVLLLAGETIADQQQWNFQTDKYARKDRGEKVEAEFLTTGLFRYSRHPNFFCEMSIWWSFYLFSVATTGDWVNPYVIGTALLTLLFQGSTPFTEKITLAKYPEYAEYQKRTSRLIPLPPRG
ncbi:MAG: DUF1295 domain-containing protein [Myxococcales bacterium]|nr:DUF1295 domain-containing protein [Myxococcales bacterium]